MLMAEAGFTPGRTSQPIRALQHEEVSKVWLSGLSSMYLVLVLLSAAQFPEAFANLPWCFGCPDQARHT